ncbi:MAG TPA: trehalase family glycosidase, partial [Mucilaginibacter sp.]|nr:trehalase family glycosidase [Mucilaginibacter sp.]
MRRILAALLITLVTITASAQIKTPRQLFPGLFEAVQLSDIFPDNKTFVDATPRRDPALIMQDYNTQKDKAGFDLKQFVSENFVIPGPPKTFFKSDISTGIRKHIDTLWEVLYRKHDTVSKYSSLLPLPNDFIIPGG